MENLQDVLSYTVFSVGAFSLQVSSLIKLFMYCASIVLSLYVIKKAIFRPKSIDISRKHAVYLLIKYVTIVFSLVIALQILGFNLSVLLAGSAALLVGIGLGLQGLFSDFVSGIIILVDSSVKVNDVIEVNGMVCKVEKINLRTTTVLTREDKYIILPNSVLTKSQLINWTHSDIKSRFEISVRVDYRSDVKLVMNILTEAATSNSGVVGMPAPSVRFNDYGDSSLEFLLFFWSEEVFRVENIKSEIRVKIFELFKEHKITIPFPHSIIHIDREKL